LKKTLLILVITLAAASANAACIKCDQTTGWWCFMSVYGTYAHCDSPTGAGCFMWGACAGSECNFGCEFYPVGEVRFTNDLQLASVAVSVPLSYAPLSRRRSIGS